MHQFPYITDYINGVFAREKKQWDFIRRGPQRFFAGATIRFDSVRQDPYEATAGSIRERISDPWRHPGAVLINTDFGVDAERDAQRLARLADRCRHAEVVGDELKVAARPHEVGHPRELVGGDANCVDKVLHTVGVQVLGFLEG